MKPGLAVAPHGTFCGARKKQGGGRCRLVAGFRTDHVGVGKCWLHGGATPSRHARYSTVKRESLRALIAQHEADPDPLNILPELAAARALFQDFIERYDAWRDALIAWHESFQRGEGAVKPPQVLDVADAYRIVSEVTKIAERIERVRAANAISRADLLRILSEMGRTVELYVADDPTRENIKAGWREIRL